MTKIAKFTPSLLHPYYWPYWLGIILLWFLVLLPYPIIRIIGKGMGKLAWRMMPQRVDIARCNIQLCFPEMPANKQARLLKNNFESVGMAVMETGMAWFWPDWRVKKWFTVTGYENMKQARDPKKGVLLVGMHFLTLELGARIFGMLNPGIGVYRPNNNPLLDWLQTWGRLRSNKTMLDRYDLKGMIRALKQDEILWYAPDHDYGPRGSIFVPFFAVQQAATTAGTVILIRSAAPAVLPFIPRRLPGNKGYELLILPEISHELEGKLSFDIVRRMNAVVEKAVLCAPEQYMWLHRRFKTRPKGVPSRY
ncbi:LpxL/LpxP family Kdo(2)-lipid IV(A) lauroyl/palmitoleoyl acyltransferase [Pantoea sp. Nvir]|uniref:LpxL/LpxP family Kdo(2)-lipid IV(A) lauroyl/palmitoleoyl acyltransferase n=1 Tax=Pantoea sp. Nvir TaxID=2576760 RepID=UPI001356FC00|nr:LpxL/LpxP family Kdo(2)-lipid IV(A) lauroyl/palmitoleoyl acyltransferase [Pantoea sp. Nvir]MXP67124.1 LpxL/LpxP family Kdo(2)-lipid IV(A) lauroyl/palmitoleoyl acyltransferase [Pantoea sp. Nvir]CAJ0992774.1 Lipid A biosynthesis lauroyltransferase [Pantoea sp. Nvir]